MCDPPKPNQRLWKLATPPYSMERKCEMSTPKHTVYAKPCSPIKQVNSLRAEIEAVLGTDNIVPIPNDGSATDGLENPLRNELISETNQEGLQETAMQIDEERFQDQNSNSTNGNTKPSIPPNSSTHALQETQSPLEANFIQWQYPQTIRRHWILL